MKKKELTLNSEHGLHLRVAGEIVKIVNAHECQLSISCDGCKRANACSIMQLLTLGAAKGTRSVLLETWCGPAVLCWVPVALCWQPGEL